MWEIKGIYVFKGYLCRLSQSSKSACFPITFHEDSDIDVAIVSPDFGKDRFEEGVKLFEIACEVDPRIEPVPISLESYEKDTWVLLIYEIREKGIELKVT